MSGFSTVSQANVDVQVQQTVRADFTLQHGQVNESVEVNAAAEQLNTGPGERIHQAGPNQYHTAFYEFFRNYKLDAAPYAFTANHAPNQPFKWNQYGFTLAVRCRFRSCSTQKTSYAS